MSSPKEIKIEIPEEDGEGKEVFDEIAKGLKGEDTRCFPGAPEFCGPTFIKINNCEPNCGVNPLFYVVLLLVVGFVALVLAYNSDD